MLPEPDVIRFGVHSGQQYTGVEDLRQLWVRVEELGFDWISLYDHLRPTLGAPDGPCFEGTTLLAGLAARTNRIRCALMVSPVTWRHPAIMAATALTIDHLCQGRLEFGVGAGGPDRGYRQYGLDEPPAADRVARLDEACRILHGLWNGEAVNLEGRHYRLTDAYVSPRPIQSHLPLVVGADGPRSLRVVAAHADVWNTLAGTPASYARKVAALDGHCRSVGRPRRAIRQSVTFRALLRTDPAQAEHEAAQLRRANPPGWPVLEEYVTFGSPQRCVEDLAAFVDLGVRDFIFGARPPVDWTTLELVAAVVAPGVRAYAVDPSKTRRPQ